MSQTICIPQSRREPAGPTASRSWVLPGRLLLTLLFSVTALLLAAQDLDSLKSKKPFTLTGGVGAGANFYASNEKDKTRDPFSWNMYGNLTANLYGLALPFSFAVSRYSTSYSVPFSQVGLSPTYKWAKLHLGYRTMSLSPLVFDGQTFLGAGLELHPGKFEFGAFYGRLNKAISEDTTYDHRIEPQYSRKGYGLKLGFGNDKNHFGLSYFHGKDDPGSIPLITDTLNSLLPQENSVLGTSLTLQFLKHFNLTADLALSLLNRDMHYANLDSIGHYEVPKFVRRFTPINESSVLSYSGRSRLSYSGGGIHASVGYQRIQPDYISLGTPYTVNDLETISGNLGATALKGHLSMNASYSSQHNNLEHALASTLVARSGNLSINANISQHLNINANINGAAVKQNDGQLKLSDSIRMNQLMLNYSLSPSWVSQTTSLQHTISSSVSYTDLKDHNPVTASQAAGNNINLNGNYGLQFLKSYKGINLGISYSVYGQQDFRYHSTGVHGGGNMQLLKDHQWSLQGDIGYFLNRSGGVSVGSNTTFAINSSYNVKKHSFSLFSSYTITPPINLNPLDKVNIVPYRVNSRNFSGGISYGYQF